MQDARELTAPPVPGRYYWVPTVRANYVLREDEWPVLGPFHNDADHFPFEPSHYHVDLRFLTAPQRLAVVRMRAGILSARDAAAVRDDPAVVAERVEAHPLHGLVRLGSPPASLPAPRPRRRRCWIDRHPYQHGDNDLIRALRQRYAGAPVGRDATGRPVCPHRGAPLAGLAPDADGCVTCPLHGLRIDLAAGHVVRADDPRSGTAEG